jgi:hypothetical protein
MSKRNQKEKRWQAWQNLNTHAMKLSTKREITTDEPNAHAELILKVEGLPENTLGVLRMKFNSLAEMVEREVRENTSLTT